MTEVGRVSHSKNELVVSGHIWAAMKEQIPMLVKSGFLPESIKTPEQAMAIALKGNEVGMPIMQAFSHIHVIKGKPTISAEGMNALIRKNCPKAKLEILENDADKCTIRATRPKEKPFTHTFRIEDAKRAGLTGNPSWAKYPDAMLFARCLSAVARRVFPDCLQGISYTPEELGAEVGSDGEIIRIIEEVPTQEKLAEPPQADTCEFYEGKPEQKFSLAKIFKELGVTQADSQRKAAKELLEADPKIKMSELDEAVIKLKEANVI